MKFENRLFSVLFLTEYIVGSDILYLTQPYVHQRYLLMSQGRRREV